MVVGGLIATGGLILGCWIRGGRIVPSGLKSGPVVRGMRLMRGTCGVIAFVRALPPGVDLAAPPPGWARLMAGSWAAPGLGSSAVWAKLRIAATTASIFILVSATVGSGL